MNFVIDSHAAIASPHLLGGKAGAIARLSSEALPIPAWFALSPAAFYQSLTPTQQALLATGDSTAALANLQLEQTVQAELNAALEQLCPQGERVAVRSSALDEDGIAHSFAGQLDSFLFVSAVDVAQKVIEVWRSGFSDRILAYRREHHLSPIPHPPAVLIQQMVDADVAGVAFSANPVTGQRGVAVVSAVYGLGTALVSGDCDADTYTIDRKGQILTQQVVEKPGAHRYNSVANAVVTEVVSADRVQQPALQDDQIRAIAQLVRQVESRSGRPQDIEWAIAQGQLYLLQARPITALTQMTDPDGMLNLWDNSNIAESYGGITTPLTFSFARRAYEAVYRQFCRMMGVSESKIAQHDTTFRRMLGLLQGRIYYNLLNWYRVLALLPGFTANRRFMEQMMGVKEALPADVVAGITAATWGDRLRDRLHLLKSIGGLLTNYALLPRQIKQFYQRLDQALRLPQAELEQMCPDELAAYYHDLERQLLTRWDAPLVNDFFAMIFYGLLRKLAVKWCGDTDETLQNDLISGEGGMISAEPAQRVRQMAAIARTHPTLVDMLCQGSLAQILPQMAAVPEFKAAYQAYLDKFGDRCLEELKLESSTLHDEPLLLLRSVGQLASQKPKAEHPSAQQVALPEPRTVAEAKVKQSLQGHPFKSLMFNWVLQNARQRVRDRENLRFERTRVFGRVRRIVLEIGKRFHALDLLNASRDIFYLELEEILSFIDGTATCTNLKGLVALRQAEFERYQQLPAPGDRFQTQGIVYQGNSFQSRETAPAPEGDTLQGLGCCPGIVRAPVQVITDPKQAQLKQGSILVAERTDPGWIMLFPSAVGLLVERGSLLSHSAIVAREMGIPAIVSIAGVTQWLKDGDWVEMDGSTGTIRRIEMQVETVPLMPETSPSGSEDNGIEPSPQEVSTNG